MCEMDLHGRGGSLCLASLLLFRHGRIGLTLNCHEAKLPSGV